MPEMIFRIRWPDKQEIDCYSPSLVVREHLLENTDYPIADFIAKAELALTDASERVRARYGFPCSRARGQLHVIKTTGARFLTTPDSVVRVLSHTF